MTLRLIAAGESTEKNFEWAARAP